MQVLNKISSPFFRLSVSDDCCIVLDTHINCTNNHFKIIISSIEHVVVFIHNHTHDINDSGYVRRQRQLQLLYYAVVMRVVLSQFIVLHWHQQWRGSRTLCGTKFRQQ